MPKINSDEDEIVKMTDVDLNGHTALLLEFKNNTDTPVNLSKAYCLRFQPDSLMIYGII